MHYIYRSNYLDSLAELLVAVEANSASQTTASSLLEQQVFVVPSTGMGQWLKQFIAKHTGIAANIDCILPSQWLWRLYDQNLSNVPKSTPFDKAPLTWLIVKQLEDKFTTGLLTEHERNTFQPLLNYVQQTPQQLRYYQFSKTLANLYDKYLVYRQDVLSQWEKPLQNDDTNNWQSSLWNQLVTTQKDSAKPLHRLHWHKLFLHKIQQTEAESLKLPATYFFGINSLPPLLIETINHVCQYLDMHSFILSPCRQYWSDIHKDNSIDADDNHALLASWGKMGRDFFKALQTEHSQLATSTSIEPFAPKDSQSLLAQIQNSILDAQTDTFTTPSDDDSSLTFHRCYTPLREVQVLHDQILHTLDSSDIEAKDIIVMMPDVEAYQPYVDAIFGQSDNSTPRLPYNISDRSAILDTDICQYFFELLKLPEHSCSNLQVIEWLHIPAVQHCFNISNNELDSITRWLKDSAIYWGLSQAHQNDLGADLNQNHWRFGLNRLMTAYTMGHDALDNPILCNALLSAPKHSFDKQHTQAKLWLFIDCLEHYRKLLKQNHTIEQWQALTNALLDDFFSIKVASNSKNDTKTQDTQTNMMLSHIRKSIEDLYNNVSGASYQSTLSADMIIDALTELLNTHRETAPFLSGGINFCTLTPLRALPFKAVFILGMNQTDFPRIDQPLSFDVMARHPRTSDRSQTHEDKYLFLEAVMSAEQKLGLFWQAWDLHDNSEKAPSALVTELRLFIANHFGNICDNESADSKTINNLDLTNGALKSKGLDGNSILNKITYDHALNAMDKQNYIADAPSLLKSYNQQEYANAAGEYKASSIEAEFTTTTISEVITANQLARFFNKPSREFLKRSNISFYEPHILQEHENFSLKAWQLKQLESDLLEQLLLDCDTKDATSDNKNVENTQKAIDKHIATLAATGHYPYNIEEIAYDSLKKLEPLAKSIQSHFTSPSKITIEYVFNYNTINNNTDTYNTNQQTYEQDTEPKQLMVKQTITLFNDTLVDVFLCRLPKDSETHKQLQVWFNWLLLCATNKPKNLFLISEKGKGLISNDIPALSSDEAQFILNRILNLYIKSHQTPLAINAKHSYSLCTYLNNKVDIELHHEITDILHPQLEEYESTLKNSPKQSYKNTEEAHLFPDGVFYSTGFVEQSKTLWLPWIEKLTGGNHS